MIHQRMCSLICSCLTLVTMAAFLTQTSCMEPTRPKSKTRQAATSQTAANTADSDRSAEQLRQQFEKDRSASNQIRLAEAQSEAADAHVAMARQFRADHRPREARRELTAALAQMPAHPQAITMAREVDKEIAQADALVRQAVAARDKKDDITALHCADQVLALDRTDATARQIVDSTRGAALSGTLQQATQALDKRQWDAATAAAAKVRQIDPANAQAKDIEKKAADRKHALELAESSRAATAKSDDATAIRSMTEATTLWPDNTELTAERDRVKQAAIDRRIAKGNAECAAGRFPAGFAEYDAALAVAPGDAKIAQHRQQAIAKRLDYLRDTYEKQALLGQWEPAWAAAVQLATLRPTDDVQSFQDMARAEDMIRQGITCRLRIVPLPSSSTQAAGVLAVARAISDELRRIQPPHYLLAALDTSADVIAKTPLTLADIGNSAKLKAIAPDLTDADLFLFVDVTSREFTVRQPAAAAQPTALTQAQLELQQAKEGLGRARQLALADERKWDAEARHALNADETFLPRAATGAYGLLAQKAAEDYNAALRKLQKTPIADQHAGQSPSSGDAKPALQLGVRLRLVQATTGRLIWTDDEIDTKVTDVAPTLPTTQPGGAGAELQAAAVRQIVPMLQSKARELLTRRSLIYIEDAQKAKGDEVARLYTRFLFDLSSDPGPFVVTPAIDEIFSKRAGGADLEACRKLAAKRLKLKLGSAATMPAPAVASAPAAPAAPATPSASAAPKVAAAPSLPARPAQKPAASATPPLAAKRSAGREPAPAAPSAQPVVTTTGVVVFDGYISRGDKRFPKERTLIDGINILLKDTDDKPLDTDLQITVGKYSGKFKALVPGTRLRIRGQSGQEYRLTILGIEHNTHKVHFTLERPSVQPR